MAKKKQVFAVSIYYTTVKTAYVEAKNKKKALQMIGTIDWSEEKELPTPDPKTKVRMAENVNDWDIIHTERGTFRAEELTYF